MARLLSNVEVQLNLYMRHQDQSNENSKNYEFEAFQGATITNEFVELLFKNFFNGEYGGKTSTNEAGKFKLKLNGYDNNGNNVSKEIVQEDIYITKYEENTNYIFKINDSDLTPVIYSDEFYLTDIEFYYIPPNPETGSFGNEIKLVSSTYPSRTTFAVDIPNTDPTEKGVYLDPNISQIAVYFDYKIIIAK